MNFIKCSIIAVLFSMAPYCVADDVFRLRMFFGLSLPSGGAVSLDEWHTFQQNEIANVFEGFNVVDSVGYYQGKAERSKIVTVIVEQKDIQKAKKIAALYARRFKQDSVMIVKVPVLEWSFVGADFNEQSAK
ncbi:DUF3574 domain-containing protein [Aliikangiella maris]|uniref:DUF3574 domain-containing protein n=2 Tax=Aliikangiella maris TaxID=3162458 RepID=A0ABV3MRU4_9GAMM